MTKKGWLLLALCTGLLSACKDDDETEPAQNPNTSLQLNFTGLEDVGPGHRYEGWMIVNGTPISTGTFMVNQAGTPSATSFQVNRASLNSASAFVLTVEPVPDTDPMPSKIKVLAGDFAGTSAQLRVGHTAALGNAFTGAAGKYLLATPTTADTTDELRGVWFIDNNGGAGPMAPGLMNLPALSNDWKYEGWVVINGTPVTTGTFRIANMADDAAPFSGPMPGPAFPGEDLIMNAPSGVTFPNSLAGQKIVVTIEPSPDNSPKPFMLKPLAGDVLAGAMEMTNYNLTNQAEATFPKGTATR